MRVLHHWSSGMLVLGLLLLDCTAMAAAWEPAPGHQQLPLWPSAPPNALADPTSEVLTTRTDHLVAGKPWHYIEHVSQPTLTLFAPTLGHTGAAVLVFPGGGYQGLAIDLEGTEACDWLTANGIACVVVKYRVPSPQGKPPYYRAYPNQRMALQDAQRALRLVRAHADEWQLDPRKIGVLGFSAGGHLVALLSVHFKEQIYAPRDAVDSQSSRPDFAMAIYPGHLALWPPSLRLNPDIATHLSRETPPTFLLQNEDDDVDNVDDALAYYVGLKGAGVPVEMHLYAHGRHAFGLRRTEEPATAWPDLAMTWMTREGILVR